MSKSQVDQDGFQKIKLKRSSRNKQTKIPQKEIQFAKEDINVDIEKALRRIHITVEELRSSKYFEDFSKAVSTVLQARQVVEIICFGLGHISECNISRYQLAFLLCVKEFCSPNKVLVHDPIFYKGECELLKRLGLQVIKENDEGSYVTSDNVTIAYFPHCPKQLTNNFLWSNWGVKLHNCLLICNSFNSLIDNNPSRIVSETVPYIYKIHPYTTELVLENNFKFTDIFNDTSLHYFMKNKLESLETTFWEIGDKMASITTKPVLVTLRKLLSELRKHGSAKKLADNQMAVHVLAQYRKNQTTDQQLCKAIDEMHFKAKNYYEYLKNSRIYKEINSELKGKGERSVGETAGMVGFKLPHDPK